MDPLGPLPDRMDYLIEKGWLKINLERALVEKAEQLCSSNFVKDLRQLLNESVAASAVAARVVELAVVHHLPRVSFCARVWCTEQKLASEVLGVKGANIWRDTGLQAAKSRWEREI
jgi:hypothetical protein